jgi:hypothetical protein
VGVAGSQHKLGEFRGRGEVDRPDLVLERQGREP